MQPIKPTAVPVFNPVSEAEQSQRAALEHRIQQSASWFFWIAGLSLLGSAAYLIVNSPITFATGLASVLAVDAVGKGLAKDVGGGALVAAVIANLAIIGMYVLFGLKSRQGKRWSFILGMVLYAGDTLLMLPFQMWLSVIFHVYALSRLWLGLQAARRLNTMTQQALFRYAAMPAAEGAWPPPPAVSPPSATDHTEKAL